MITNNEKQLRYFKTEKGKLAIKNAITKYRNSEKGRLAYAKAREKLKMKSPNYNINYMKTKREEAKENGFCPQCFIIPPVDQRKLCMGCAIKINGATYIN